MKPGIFGASTTFTRLILIISAAFNTDFKRILTCWKPWTSNVPVVIVASSSI